MSAAIRKINLVNAITIKLFKYVFIAGLVGGYLYLSYHFLNSNQIEHSEAAALSSKWVNDVPNDKLPLITVVNETVNHLREHGSWDISANACKRMNVSKEECYKYEDYLYSL